MKYVLTLVLALSCVVWSSADAQGADEESPNFQKHKILQRLCVGTWKVKGVSEGEEIEGELKGRWAPGKYCVVYSGSFGPVGSSEKTSVSGISGWDGSVGKIREQMYFSDGGVATTFFDTAGNVMEGKREGIGADGVKYTQSLRFVLEKGKWVGQPSKTVDANGKVLQEHGEWVFTRVPQVKGEKK